MIWSKLVPTVDCNSIAKIWKKKEKNICPERDSNLGPPAWTPVAIYKHWYCEQHSQSASSNGRSAGTLEQSKVRWHLWFPGTWDWEDWVEDSLWLGHFHATEVANATHTCLRQRRRRRDRDSNTATTFIRQKEGWISDKITQWTMSYQKKNWLLFSMQSDSGIRLGKNACIIGKHR